MSNRKVLFLSLSVLVAAIISACGSSGASTSPNVDGSGGQTVNITGTEFQFSPNTINARPGEKVTVVFKNTGNMQHTFSIRDLNFKLIADPGATVTGAFTAPSSPGTFTIECDVPGHTPAGMAGTLTVK